jgi:hypothetical protein
MQGRRIVRVSIDPGEKDASSWLYSNADVLESRAEAEFLVLTARMRDDVYATFRNKFPHPASDLSEDGRGGEAAE